MFFFLCEGGFFFVCVCHFVRCMLLFFPFVSAGGEGGGKG